jgi:ABC-type multidrug transport system fused ATPase/permease subunit
MYIQNNTLKKIFYILREYKKRVAFLILLLFIGMIFEMISIGIILPTLGILLSSDIKLDFPSVYLFFKKNGFESQREIIFFGMYSIIGIYFFKTIFMYYLSWVQANFSAELSAKTSSKLYSGYLNQTYSFHLLRNSSELIRNIIGEVHEFSEMLKSLFVLIIEITALFGIAIILLFKEPLGTTLIFIVLGLSTFLLQKFSKNKLLKWGEERQYHDGLMKKKINHGLLGIKDIKLKGVESLFLKEFNFHNFLRVGVTSKQYALTFFPRLYLEFIAVLGLVGFIIFQLYLNTPVNSLLPTIALFMAGAFRMIPSANRIIGSMQFIRYSKPVIDIVYNELIFNSKFKFNIIEHSDKINFKHQLELKNISYRYSETDSNVLKNINLTIKKGEVIGFIGTSGSGKSTLIDIILGLLKPESGSIFLDDVEITNIMKPWQKLIGYVPQSIFLSDDNIKNNIAFGVVDQEIQNTAIQNAIIAAQLNDFINTLPDGIETQVGEQGVRLSGGQRQRIGLARALYNNPDILILDEATSALDNITENSVMETVLKLRGDKTILLVAHRLTTLRFCDRIYKIENGKVEFEGSPIDIL